MGVGNGELQRQPDLVSSPDRGAPWTSCPCQHAAIAGILPCPRWAWELAGQDYGSRLREVRHVVGDRTCPFLVEKPEGFNGTRSPNVLAEGRYGNRGKDTDDRTTIINSTRVNPLLFLFRMVTPLAFDAFTVPQPKGNSTHLPNHLTTMEN